MSTVPSILKKLGACCLLMLALSACKPEPCADTDCVNATCLEGLCMCDPGYEGQLCTEQSRNRLLGDWVVGDICRPAAGVYDINIATGSIVNQVVFDNLYEAGIPVTAEVDSFDIDIFAQTFGLGTISGGGGIDAATRTISLEYTVDDGNGNIDVCQATLRVP